MAFFLPQSAKTEQTIVVGSLGRDPEMAHRTPSVMKDSSIEHRDVTKYVAELSERRCVVCSWVTLDN
jgi:hypothetical protein